MQMMEDYLNELANGRGIVHNETGFATYEINGEECYIVDIYTTPEHRNAKAASDLADRIALKALENGCTILTGSVVPTAHNSTISLKVLLGYGFRLHSASDNFIVFAKELKAAKLSSPKPVELKGASNE